MTSCAVPRSWRRRPEPAATARGGLDRGQGSRHQRAGRLDRGLDIGASVGGVAHTRGLTLLLPTLARVEILTLRPKAAGLSGSDREAIEARIAVSGTCDVLATWVVHASHQRGWPALSADPTRLRRVDPTVEIDLL